jgi:uncharacterized protein YjaG (DUF416 family)
MLGIAGTFYRVLNWTDVVERSACLLADAYLALIKRIMPNPILNFSESELLSKLKGLPGKNMVAFAACSAERLLPACLRYFSLLDQNSDTGEMFVTALNDVWDSLSKDEIDLDHFKQAEAACIDEIPSDDEAWEAGEPYAEDACTAVALTIRALLSGDVNNAMWAARNVYEALDNFVIHINNIKDTADCEDEVIAHPLIQNEFYRQLEDMEMLQSEKAVVLSTEIIDGLRAKAKQQALVVFG